MAKARKKRTSKKRRRKSLKIGPGASTLLALFLAICIVLSISFPYLKRSIMDTGCALPELARHSAGFAIDISHYQDKVIWDSLMVLQDAKGHTTRDLTRSRHAWPVKYAFIKASEGESMVDPDFAQYWEDAGRSRIRRGAYHFFRSSKDPLKQAENFISAVGELTWRDLPPVLDVETMHKGCTKEELNAKVLIWLKTIEEHYKRKPIIYASDSYFRDILSREISENYPVWVAHYGVERPLAEDWAMWQFSEKAVVHGVDGKIDLSVVNTQL